MNIRTIAVTAALSALAVTAFAAPPIPGTYDSIDGDILPGQYSESWFTTRNSLGNALDVESYDAGADALGTQWYLRCPSITVPPFLVEDTIDEHGTGYKRYLVQLSGGTLTLLGSGPWGAGDASYPVALDAMTLDLTTNFIKGKETAVYAIVEASGVVVGYSQSCVFVTVGKAYEIANTEEIGNKPPGTFPPFVDGSCAEGAEDGAWGRWLMVSFSITGCTTPVESSSWGSVKARYGE